MAFRPPFFHNLAFRPATVVAMDSCWRLRGCNPFGGALTTVDGWLMASAHRYDLVDKICWFPTAAVVWPAPLTRILAFYVNSGPRGRRLPVCRRQCG